jgi:uncharacterized membrane protein YraQ (UPF0718 family)
MRKTVQLVGLVMVLQGVSGTIDQLAVQPFMGVLLNAFNRYVVNKWDVFEGREIFANLVVAILGAVLIIAAERIKPMPSDESG